MQWYWQWIRLVVSALFYSLYLWICLKRESVSRRMGGARLYLSGCETVFETKEKKGRDTFMDKIDAMLITLLQENARAPLKLLASKVFLSAPAVSSRIDKLEKQGIILGYNTVIDRQKLGYHITAFINLELSADQKSEFYPFISSCPNVLECNCITGVYSMLIRSHSRLHRNWILSSERSSALAILRRRSCSPHRFRIVRSLSSRIPDAVQ